VNTGRLCVALTALVIGFSCHRGQGTTTKSSARPRATTIEQLPDGSWRCRPSGDGPFPAVLYNHGGSGQAIGGDLKGTCVALAEAGYVAHSERRRETRALEGHLQDVFEALDALRASSNVDTGRIGIMGFSRGGLLALQVAVRRPNQVQAAVLLAPAPGKNQLSQTLSRVSRITAPVGVFVARNDQDSKADHLALARDVVSALEGAEKEVEFTIYPPYKQRGHELFQTVQDPYWADVIRFFDAQLAAQ
jgi:dienelactone hydrolase